MAIYHGSAVLRNDGTDSITNKKDLNAGVSIPVKVEKYSDDTDATLYDINDNPIANPVTTDSKGNFVFKAADDEYNIYFNKGTADEVKQERVQVYSLDSVIVSPSEVVLSFDTLADVVASTEISAGDSVNLKERTTGNGGGAMWDVVLASSVTANTFDIVACTGVASLALVLRKKPATHSDQWGLGGTPPANSLTLAGNLRYSAIIAGRNNSIDMGAGAIGKGDGATICGGNDNSITATYDGDCQGAFIGGGWSNAADGYWVTIAGGKGNEISGDITNYSFIGGGNTNLISGTQAFLSVIGGGRDNVISGDTANRCFIGGGGQNTITGTAVSRATLVGGEDNSITGNNAYYTFLGGGQRNQITGQTAGHSVLVGGVDNQIAGSTATYSFIGGGQLNDIGAATGSHTVIVGGRENDIQNNAQYSSILGGYLNKMNGQRSFIGGGYSNNVGTASGTQNAIVGGNQNKMLSTTVQNSFIGGGYDNEIGTSGSGTVLVGVSILGGEDNIAIASRASVLGGKGLRADSYLEVVKGTYNDPANPDGIGAPSKTAYVGGQIAEALGIGADDASRANAYVWLKNGKQIRYNTPVYADNTAAIAGGELVGTVYRTATGQLMEVY